MHHRVYVLSLDAAISMLKENEVILTTEESENIANLTGRIPLALVCALLHYTSPQEIITELQRHPINIFNSSELPERRRIHVSFILSLRYLDKELRTFSFSLTFFPGSFTKKSASYIMKNTHTQDSKSSSVEESLRSLFKGP